MRDLPSGTVSFLFTDVEGSTQLLHEIGAEAYARALDEHRRLLREAFAAHGGVEVDTQGDAFFVAFPTAPGALSAAADAQRRLVGGPIKVRMGIHTGTPLLTDEGYVGVDVHRARRIAAAAHGGQVLVSAPTRALVDGAGLRDLGEHRLKDLAAQERIWQLGDTDFPRLKTLFQTNLPVPPTPFLGRERELRGVVTLLEQEDASLVTLTGPGGTGKTRLALQAAAEASETFPGGVTWVPLAPLRDPALVLPTAARALGVEEEPGRPLADTVITQLTGTRRLLLFDNAEHLLPAVATDVACLRAADGLTLLVTGRERMQLQGEKVWPVPPLEEPDGVALFTERALALDPSFRPRAAVVELCARLDHLPLALELAAARTPLFSPEQLLSRLEERLDLLRGGRDAEPRQQTLRATIAWSYDLLDEAEQRLFRRLAVFVAGCLYDAAEAICGADPDTLQSLLDKSLVQRRDTDVGPRYWMLETIREFAREVLQASGEADMLRRRHAECLLGFSEQAARGLWGEEIPPWSPLGWLQAELPNLRAAFEWAFEQGEVEIVLRLAASAGHAWGVSGSYVEGRALLARALDDAHQLLTPTRAKALLVFGNFAVEQGDFSAAEAVQQEALELYKQHEDDKGTFWALFHVAHLDVLRGAFDHAQASLREARALLDRATDFERASACFAEAGLEGSVGDFTRAQALVDEGLELLRAFGWPRGWCSYQLINVGWWALLAQDFPRAKSALEDYLADSTPKNPLGIATAHGNLGFVALYEGDRDGAASHFSEQLRLVQISGARLSIAEALYGLAAVAAMDGQAERSVRLGATADAIKEAIDAPLSQPEQFVVERYVEPARRELPGSLEHEFSREASATPLDKAVAYALSQR